MQNILYCVFSLDMLCTYMLLIKLWNLISFAEEEISSYSVAQYFRSLGHKCTQVKQSVKFKMHNKFPIPVINQIENYPETESSCDYKAVYDWLGAVSCDVDL